MKTLIATLAISVMAFAGSAQAQHYQRPGSPSLNGYGHYHPQHRHYHHPHRHRDWVGPAIITGIGTAIIVDQIHRRNQPGTIVVEEVVTPAPVVVVPNCSSWREVQLSDGTIYRERICSQ